ncbi:MAG: hypothetical protein NZ898_06020 [Myxococcota bacterium]|nr:hypothetical protein [Myxococcota bacterium]MDW8362168.1 hypothetical protein [Myxococcales bacterium]
MIGLARVIWIVASVATSGCAVDTETGVTAEIAAAAVTVWGGGEATVVAVRIDAAFRVGEHARGTRSFRAPRADVLVDERVVATVNLDRPVGFDPMLSPGERDEVTLTGASVAGAFPAAHDALCATGGDARAAVLLHWEDLTSGEMGRVRAGASVRCES